MDNSEMKPPPFNNPTENKSSSPVSSVPKQMFKGSKQIMVNLFAGAGLVIIYEWASTSDMHVVSAFWPMVIIEAGLFIVLGIWANQKPYKATLASIAVVILFSIIFFAMMGTDYLLNAGLAIKLMTIFGIGVYLSSAKKLESANQAGK